MNNQLINNSVLLIIKNTHERRFNCGFFFCRNSRMSSIDTSFIEDLPSGPLDEYRRQSKLDWKQLKVFFEGNSDLLKTKVGINKNLEKK